MEKGEKMMNKEKKKRGTKMPYQDTCQFRELLDSLEITLQKLLQLKKFR